MEKKEKRRKKEEGKREVEGGDIPQERRESAVGERPENHPLRAKFENCTGWLL
jgi:hypothetical protein